MADERSGGSKLRNWYANYHSDDRSRWMSTDAPAPKPVAAASEYTAAGGQDQTVVAELARQTDHLEAIRRYVGWLLAIVVIQIAIAFLFVVSQNA